MPRLLISGAAGQLGGDLLDTATARGIPAVGFSHAALDITDRTAVARALDEQGPDAVINCAAWTNVDGAESHADRAFAVNLKGARLLAEECAQRDVLLMHLSTDYVFDGESPRPIPENAAPAPLSIYGASKLAGEEAVRAVSDNHVIVRTSGLYGRDGPNFLLKVLHRAARGEQLRVVTDQVTAPTWTGHLAPALLRLIEMHATGTFHLTNSGRTSWYEFAVSGLRTAGLASAVQPILSAELPASARRPQHAVLDNCAWLHAGEPALPTWSVALDDYIGELRRRGRLPASLVTA
ncbi:MAG: dTDP-4-dehydrorhamnose reductase [Candidatus Dormibacteraeota bacterium]|nr:dTDP-4-dehydrorhamnose reductase [Candidatus Dormibacteraeota bacterium]